MLADASSGKAEVILIGSGSKIRLAVPPHDKLIAEGIRSRVAPLKELQKKFGFEPEQVAAATRELLGGR